MTRPFSAERRIAIGVLAAALAAVLLVGCVLVVVAAVRQPHKPKTSTYTVAVHQSLRAASTATGTVTDAAITAATPRSAVLTFQVADSDNGKTRTIRVHSVQGTGDPTQVAAAQGLVDVNVMVGGTPAHPTTLTALPVAQANEVAILEDTLAQLPTGRPVGPQVTDKVATFKGRPAQSAEGVVNAKVTPTPTVAYIQVTPETGYFIDSAFQDAFGGPGSIPSDTEIQERSPGIVDQISGIVVCIFSFLFDCQTGGPISTAVPVAGPPANVHWIGAAPATAAQVDLRQGHLLLTAAGSGTVNDVGSIPAQANLPTQISQIGVRQQTDWTATASIASKLQTTTGELALILCLGLAILLLSGICGVVAIRQLKG